MTLYDIKKREIITRLYPNHSYKSEDKLLRDTKEFLLGVDNCKYLRFDAITRAGVADILVCYRGIFVSIELKDDIGKASLQQSKWRFDIEKAGGIAVVCKNIFEVFQALERAEEKLIS